MKKQGFLKGSAVLMVMVLVTKILGLIYKVPLTTMLGGSGMSCYSGAFAVFTPVFAAAAAGIPGALSRIISEQLALGRYRNAVKIRQTALLVFSLTAVALSVGLILASRLISEKIIHIPQAYMAVAAISLSLLPASVMNVRRGWAEGLGQMTPTASSEIAETVFKLIAGLALPAAVLNYARTDFVRYHGCFGHYCSDMREVMLTAAPYAAAASALGVSTASLLACIFISLRTRKLSRICEREFQNTSLPLNISFFGAVKLLAKFALPASLITVIATLSGMADLISITPRLNAAMDKSPQLFAFLESFSIAREERAGFVYGSYTGLSLTIFGLLPTFTAMLGKSALPSLTTAYACRDRCECGRRVSTVLLLSSALSTAGGLGICALARPLLVMFFGSSTAEIAVSYKPLAILGIAVIFMGISLPCMSALQACGKQITAAVINVVGAAVKLVLNLILIGMPRFNICGAAISTAVSQAVMCVWAAVVLIRCSGAGKEAVKSLFMPILPSLLCTSAAVLTQKLIVSRIDGTFSRFGVLISVTFGAIICLISFALLCISPKNTIISFFSKKFSKTT